MNDEILLKLYNKYGLSKVGDFDAFKLALQTPQGRQKIHAKYLSSVGSFEQFEQAIGNIAQVDQSTEPIPNQLTDSQIIDLENENIKSVNPVLQIPLLGDLAIAGGRAIGSVITDQIPQTISTLQLKGSSARADELAGIIERNPQLADRPNMFGGPTLREDLTKTLESIQPLEQEIQTQKTESTKKLAGNVQDITDVKSATDFASWLGNSIGQAAGQIPLSVATMGGASFLMEAAEVYDQQLDLLAEKHGLTREDILKNNLDDPAAGEVFAILAGSLDAASAGSIMKIFKAAAGNNLKKNVIKSFLKNALGEAATEGIQGQLETGGATVGAGTEFTFDFKKFINEAAAGFVGGGALGAISNDNPSVERAKRAQTINKDTSTGDPNLDAEIDDLIDPAASIVEKALATVENAGSMLAEQKIKAAEKKVADIKAEMARVERENLILQKREEFDAIPATPLSQLAGSPGPGIAAAEEETLQNDISGEQVLPIVQPTQPEASIAPVESTVLAPTVMPASIKQRVSGKKTTEPKVETPKEVKKDIPADIKETKFHSTDNVDGIVVDDNFEKNVTKLGSGFMHIGDEAAANQRAEENKNKPTRKYKLKLNPKAKFLDVEDIGEPLHIENIFKGLLDAGNITKELYDKEIAALEEYKKNMQEVGRTDVNDKLQEYAAEFAKSRGYDATRYKNTAEGSGYSYGIMTRNALQGIKEIVEKKPVEKAKVAEDLEKKEADYDSKITKAQDSVLSNVKRNRADSIDRINKTISNLTALYKKTQYEPFLDMAKEAKEAIVTLEKIKQTKTEKAEVVAEKEANSQSAEEVQAERDRKRADREAKEANKRSAKVTTIKANPKLGQAFAEDRTEPFGKIRTDFYKAIARAIKFEFGTKEIDTIVEAYFNYLKDNDIPLTFGKENKIIDRNYVISKANTYIEDVVKEKERKTASQKIEIRKNKVRNRDAERAAKADFEKAMGIDPGSFDDIIFMSTSNSDELSRYQNDRILEYIDAYNLGKATKKEITADEYIALAPKGQANILKALHRVIGKYRSKSTKFITVEVTDKQIKEGLPFLGFQVTSNNARQGTIVILVDKNGNPAANKNKQNVVLHESLHDYTRLMFTRLYSLDKGFRVKMEHVFYNIQSQVTKQIEQLDSKLFAIHGGQFSEEELKKFQLTNEEIVLQNALEKYSETSYTADGKTQLSDLFYGFTDVDEFLSESFSNPKFVAFLSQVKLSETISSGPLKGERKSLLYKWFEDLFNFVKKNFKLTPVENNALDYALHTISLYDAEFVEGNLPISKSAIDFLSSISNARAKQPVNPATKAAKTITYKLANLLELNRQITSENDVLGFIKKINNKLSITRQLGDPYATAIWKVVKKHREQLSKDKKAREFYLGKLKERPEYKDKTSKFYHDVQDIEAVDLNKLTAVQRKQLIVDGYAQLTNDSLISSRAYNIILNTKSEKHIKVIVDNKEKINAGWLTRGIAKATNPMTTATALGKYNKAISDYVMKALYEGTMWAYSQSGTRSDVFWKSLSTVAEQNKLSHSNLVRIGMVGGIYSTITNPNVSIDKWENEVRENAELAVKNANNKLVALNDGTYQGDLKKREIEKELEIALDILKKVKGKINLDTLMSKEERKIYDMITDFAKKHEMEFFRNAKAVWGQTPPQRYNYFPTMAQGRVGETNVKNYTKDSLIRTSADNVFDALDEGDKNTYNAVFGKKVWSSYQRTNPKEGYYYEYDALAIGKKWGKNLLFDIYASSELKVANRVLKDSRTSRAIGAKMRNTLVQQMRLAAGAGMKYDPNVSRFWKGMLKLSDYSYMAGMLNAGQLVLQASSGVAAAMVISSNINPLTAGKIFSKAIRATFDAAAGERSKFYQKLQQEGLGIQLRDTGYEKYLSADDYRGYIPTRKLTKWSETASEFAITNADKFAARLVWFSTYFDAGGTMDTINQEAARKAERITSTLQGISDVRWTPQAFAYDSLFAKIAARTVYAYKRFSLNAWLSFVGSIRNINEPEARTIAAAQFGSYLAYHAVGAYLTRPFWNWAAEQILGDDGDDDEEKRVSKLEEVMYGVGWDMTIGSPAPAFMDQTFRHVFTNLGFVKNKWAPIHEDYDRFLDSPLYAPADLNAFYEGIVGPGLKEPVTAGLGGLELLLLYSNVDAYAETDEQAEEKDFKTRQWNWNSSADVIGAAPFIPFRGDVRKMFKEMAKKDKVKYYQEKEFLRGVKSGTNIDIENGLEAEPIEEVFYEDYIENEDYYNQEN